MGRTSSSGIHIYLDPTHIRSVPNHLYQIRDFRGSNADGKNFQNKKVKYIIINFFYLKGYLKL